MRRWKIMAVFIATATFLFCTYLDSTHGQRSRRSRIRSPNTNVELRIASLEQRVLVLETLMSVKSSPTTPEDVLNAKSVEQWERDLATAEQRLQHSTRMEAKGYLTKFALFEDQLAVQRARQYLALAQGDTWRAKQAELQLAVLQAERDVASASADLKLTKVQTRYGIGASTNYQARYNALTKTLETAEARLQAARETLQQHEQTTPPDAGEPESVSSGPAPDPVEP